MQISESVIRLDLANSSDQIIQKPVQWLLEITNSPGIRAHFCCCKQSLLEETFFFLLFCVKFTSLQLAQLQNHGLDVTLNLFVGLHMSLYGC